MKKRQTMYCISKMALSMDGYLDDTSPERFVFSGAEDRAVVDALRAEADAILIGAETLRSDNPGLLVRSEKLSRQREASGLPAQPLRVILSKSARLPPSATVFSDTYKTLVCCPSDCEAHCPNQAEVFGYNASGDVVAQCLEELSKRGVKRLLIEGGAQIHSLFLKAGMVDVVRLAVAPICLGEQGGVSLFQALAGAGFFIDADAISRLGTESILLLTPTGKSLHAKAVFPG